MSLEFADSIRSAFVVTVALLAASTVLAGPVGADPASTTPTDVDGIDSGDADDLVSDGPTDGDGVALQEDGDDEED